MENEARRQTVAIDVVPGKINLFHVESKTKISVNINEKVPQLHSFAYAYGRLYALLYENALAGEYQWVGNELILITPSYISMVYNNYYSELKNHFVENKDKGFNFEQRTLDEGETNRLRKFFDED